MKRILLLAIVAAACSPKGPGSSSPDSLDLAAAAATITAADVYDRVAFLASDELLGRDTPSPGLDSAAQWIADQMATFGLQPAGEDGWFQHYPYPAEGLDSGRTAFIAAAGKSHSFQYGRDFFAERGRPLAGAVGAVYAGSGIGAPEGTLRDRAVLVRLDAVPQASRWGLRFERDDRGRIGEVRAAAREAGASAVVFLLDPRLTAGEVLALAERAEQVSRVYGGVRDDERPLPTFFLARPATERLFRLAGLEAETLLVERLARPVPLPGVTLQLAAPVLAVDDARAPNVAGVLHGSDPALRDEYVVVSAHMDHVGVGRPDESGDSIYNGADDDASGTSVMLEVAEAMARLERRPRRSVIFLAVSGEEKGLLGSRWYANHPTVPLESIIANINLDMVARNAPDSIVVIGQEYSSLGHTVQEVARRHHDDLGLTVSEDLWPEQRFFFRSDHFSFAGKEIPALFFFSGTHDDYHRPSDEVDTIDTDKSARVGRLVFHLTHDVADARRPPRWDPVGLEEVRSLTRR